VTLLQAAILGVVQGLTEFLPISSDGHLAITYRLMGTAPNLSFEVLLHAATLIAMVVYFWSDGLELLSSLLPRNSERTGDRRLIVLITLGTAVSAVVALAFEPYIERLTASSIAVGLGFLGTTLVLVLAEMADRKGPNLQEPNRLSFPQICVVGLLQGLAVLPGLSRSGTTIGGTMLFGVSREKAARFSFLFGIPIIALAAAKDVLAVVLGSSHLPQGVLPALVVGFVVAGLSGYGAMWGLLRFVKNHSLLWFAAYTGVLGTAILLGATVFGRG